MVTVRNIRTKPYILFLRIYFETHMQNFKYTPFYVKPFLGCRNFQYFYPKTWLKDRHKIHTLSILFPIQCGSGHAKNLYGYITKVFPKPFC